MNVEKDLIEQIQRSAKQRETTVSTYAEQIDRLAEIPLPPEKAFELIRILENFYASLTAIDSKAEALTRILADLQERKGKIG